jgi:Condensation domain
MHEEAPLSYGQLYSYREIESYPEGWRQEANLPATWDLRGCSAGRVEDALRRLIARHEALRTTYASGPVQRVHADVAPPLERVDRVITDFGEPERTTTARLEVPLPMADALCWRGILVSTGGAPMYLSLSFSHLMFDVWSVQELSAQFRALLADPDADLPVAPSPRELARGQRERSGGGAERYWRRVLTDDLIHQLPTLPLGAQRNRIQATLHSHRLGGLAAQAGRALGVTPPAVVMALVAAGLAEHTGAERVVLSLMSSNRFAQEHQHAVGTMNQLVPVVSTVDSRSTLAEHITRLHWAGAKAYRYSCYDVDRVAALAASVGAAGNHDCWFNHLFQAWFNYLQLDDRPCSETAATDAELVWTPVARQYGQPFDVRVSVRDGRTSVALRVDPDVIPAEAVTGILRAVALGAWRAATDPGSTLKDLWSSTAADLPTALYPSR